MMQRVDFLAGTPFGTYDATRAVSEGRYTDAMLPAITAAAPWAGKIIKTAIKAFPNARLGGEAGDLEEVSDPTFESNLDKRSLQRSHEMSMPDTRLQQVHLPQTTAPAKSDLTAPTIIPSDTALVVAKPHIIRPDTSLAVPRPYIAWPIGRDAHEAKRGDSFIPTLVPWPQPMKEPEINFTLPRHWKQRSSPWVAQYPPMTMRRRPFRLDYPEDPPTDAQGRILFDIEGRPLTARIVIGRNELGKSDRALDSGDMVKIIKDDLGLDLVSAPKNYFKPNTIGHLSIDPKNGRLAEIAVWNELPADQEDVTIAHELGHVFDIIARNLSVHGIDDELIPLYSAHSTGRIGPPYLLPDNRGYAPHIAPRERAAEAFRIYATGPNTMKTTAPKAAAAIRALNTHPFFSKVIQFNGVPFGVPAGAVAATAGAFGAMANSDDANAAPARQTSEVSHRGGFEKRNTDRGLASITNALSRLNRHASPRRGEKLRDFVQTLTQLEHKPRIHRYGGPR